MHKILNSKNLKITTSESDEYVYYAPTGLILKISNNTFADFIKRAENDNIIPENKTDKFFIDLLVKTIKNSGEATFRNVTNELKSIILNISGNCNLRCAYCFARQNGKFNFANMSVEQGLKIIDFAVNKNSLVKTFDICFFGGEPMLMFDTMKSVVENIEHKYENVKFLYSITTNGTIVSGEIISFLKTYNFSILVSFDGQTNNRPFNNGENSTNQVLLNVEKFANANIPITLRPTITSNSTEICETFDFFEKLKIPFVFSFAYNSVNKEHNLSNYSQCELQSIDNQLSQLMKYYENIICNDKIFYCQTIKESLSNIHFRLLNSIACAAGFSSFTINADGSIYTCQHFANNIDDACGNIETGIDKTKKLKFRSPFLDDIKECQSCWVRYLCGGCCFAEKYAQNGRCLQNIPEKCELEKIKWKKILQLSQKIKDNKPDFFNQLKKKYETTT
ncbi:MAG: 4Fe-4S cluster-binding domain-containing protein [Prevotellaceae bacterium]|jgi:uncharacterized protein|nr:4Fe-4S cluster-binding domain-containing protein [Prevotellaceae bacterium]